MGTKFKFVGVRCRSTEPRIFSVRRRGNLCPPSDRPPGRCPPQLNPRPQPQPSTLKLKLKPQTTTVVVRYGRLPYHFALSTSMSVSGLSTPCIIRGGARCIFGERRPLPPIRGCRRRHRHEYCGIPSLVHPSSLLDIKTNQTTPHHFSKHWILCRRSIQRQPTSETNKLHQQHQFREQLPRRRPASDPTAKRPTQKCDPYGLAGKSLSHIECLDLLSTLDTGWRLLFEPRESSHDEASIIHNHHDNSNSDRATTTTTSPTFLQKYYYHPTFYEASKFISHIALLATNHNHYPHLSIDRILVEDMNTITLGGDTTIDNVGNGQTIKPSADDDPNGTLDNNATMKKKLKKVTGWIFRSTVRCSTCRPPSSSSNTSSAHSSSSLERDKLSNQGLTYHDFHLAMSLDVEVNREDVKRWLWRSSSDAQD